MLRHPFIEVRCAALVLAVLTAACAPLPSPGPGSASAPTATPAAARTAAPPDGTVILSIIGTNDVHGGIVPRDGRGGLAVLGGYAANLRAARARDGGAVLLIDAGDIFQGTLESNLSEGLEVVSAYNALGYAAATIGNHEFDFGPVGQAATPRQPSDDPRGAWKRRASEARFPFLAANLIDAATARPVAWTNVRPSTIVEAAGIKVGVVGVMTATALAQTIAANTGGLRVSPLVPAIAAEASLLRGAGAAVVIVTAHAGGRCDRFDDPMDLSSCSPSSEIFQVARELPPGLVDVIIAGHSHAGVAHQVAGIAIAEQFATGRAFGRVDVAVDRASRRVLSTKSFPPRDLCVTVTVGTEACDVAESPASPRGPAQYEGASVVPDLAVARILDPVVERVRALKESLLGVTAETPIRRAGRPNSPLGNLFVDTFLTSVPAADIAFNNTVGGLRTDLAAGPLTYGRLFEVLPFDNRLVQFWLTGSQVRTVVAAQLAGTRGPAGIAGFTVRATCSNGALAIDLARPDGRLMRDDDRLLTITTDFLATGGDDILTPAQPAQGFALTGDQPLARDVVADALRKRGGTLRETDLLQPDRPRWSYPGSLPVRCGAGVTP